MTVKTVLGASLVVAVISATSHATVIGFETTPSGGTPTDNAELSRTLPYSVDGVNVTFGFDTNNDGSTDVNGLFEHIGDEGGGFPGPNGFFGSFGVDTAFPGLEPQLGEWFLRSPDDIPANIGVFIIEYDTPVTALSGEIWDIDGFSSASTEQWELRVYDASNTLLDTLISPLGDSQDFSSLDAKPWAFGFDNLAGAKRVEAEFIGTKTDRVGFSFNNYNATTIPEPAALSLLALGGLLMTRRRR